jgi:hypothetical protein
MKTYIMNAEGLELEAIIKGFCSELDNLTQVAADAGDEDVSIHFSKDYNEIELFYFKVKKKELLSFQERNKIREIMKTDLKQAGIYYC